MPEFNLVDVEEVPYLYVTKSCSMDPNDISENMGASFQEVWAFMQSKGIEPAGGALSVYYTYDPNSMRFRAGFVINRGDMEHAEGEIAADVTPSGKVLHFIHKGPYRTLRDDYALMVQHVTKLGKTLSAPTWEVYLNDPSRVPEEELLTEVFAVLT